MDNKFSNIKERILYLVEYHKDTKESFFEKIGMTYGNFKGEAKKTPINSTSLANILTIYSDVNPDWLIFGTNPMLREEIKDDYIRDKIPVVDSTSMGFILDRYENLVAENTLLKKEVEDLKTSRGKDPDLIPYASTKKVTTLIAAEPVPK